MFRLILFRTLGPWGLTDLAKPSKKTRYTKKKKKTFVLFFFPQIFSISLI